MKNCTLWGKPIQLSPSAAERAAKYGNTVAYYTNLFTIHAECQVRQWHKVPTVDKP